MRTSFYRGSGIKLIISEEFRQAFNVDEIQKQLDEWTNKAAQEGFRDLISCPYKSGLFGIFAVAKLDRIRF